MTIGRYLPMTRLARKLGFSRSWLYCNLGRLMAEEGFPRPVTIFGKPRWDAVAVDRWMDQRSGLSPTAAPKPLLDDIEAWHDVLDGRAVELALHDRPEPPPQ